MTEKLRVGYAGVGLMGHGATKHILLGGYPLAILAHRNRAPVDDLVARGAAEAKDAAALARGSDVIFLCLPSAKEVEDIVLGGGGMLEAMRPGTILVDKSSGTPAFTRCLRAICQSVSTKDPLSVS